MNRSRPLLLTLLLSAALLVACGNQADPEEPPPLPTVTGLAPAPEGGPASPPEATPREGYPAPEPQPPVSGEGYPEPVPATLTPMPYPTP